jgi:hypothetical protein
LFRLEQGEKPADISLDLDLSEKAGLHVHVLAELLAGQETLSEEYPNDFSCCPHLNVLFKKFSTIRTIKDYFVRKVLSLESIG